MEKMAVANFEMEIVSTLEVEGWGEGERGREVAQFCALHFTTVKTIVSEISPDELGNTWASS